MSEESNKEKQPLTEHQKMINDRRKIIDNSNEYISYIRKSVQKHQELINKQRQELDEIIEKLRRLKD